VKEIAVLGLEELRNLQQLDEMKNLQKLDQLKQLQHIESLDKLQPLNQLQHIESLDKLQPLNQLQHIESLDKLQPLNQLQHLDKLSNLQMLDKLQNLSAINNMHYLDKLQHVDHLQQLRMLDKLGNLQELARLQNMQTLKNLNQMQNLNELSRLNNLQYMENLQQMHNLQSLQQLEVLNRLNILNNLLAFKLHRFLYLLSIVVPGLIFQETITLLGHSRLGLKRALVLMTAYNVLNLILCAAYGFRFLEEFSAQPLVYYAGWFCILILFPILIGSLVSFLSRSRLFTSLTGIQYRAANAWDRFLAKAENYQMVITLNNEEKIRGIFHRSDARPETGDPRDIYFTETAHYDPASKEWKKLGQPVNIWVKGSEIKIVELSPESGT
jgi:hypothetical protein